MFARLQRMRSDDLPALARGTDAGVRQRAVTALIRRISDRNPKVQRAVAEALGRFGQEDVGDDSSLAVLALTKALAENNGQSRADAQQVQIDTSAALGNFGAQAAVAVPQLQIALQSWNPGVQRAAAFALAQIGPMARTAAPALQTTLVDGGKEVRRVAAFALGRIDPPAANAAPALITALGDPSSDVREAASSALANLSLSGTGALPVLIKAVEDKDDPRVRSATAKLLGEFAEHSNAANPKTLAYLKHAEEALTAPAQGSGR